MMVMILNLQLMEGDGAVSFNGGFVGNQVVVVESRVLNGDFALTRIGRLVVLRFLD